MNNYRPISLLSPLAKVFEKLKSIRLTKFLKDNNILADQQLGFRKGKGHSTTQAVTDIYSQICSNPDNDKLSCVLLLDLKKAFDTVSHEILPRNLHKYSIRGKSNKLFQGYVQKINNNSKIYFPKFQHSTTYWL